MWITYKTLPLRQENGKKETRGECPSFFLPLSRPNDWALERSMISEERVRELVEGLLSDESQFLVDVTVNPGNIIVVELDSDDAIQVSQLAEVNRGLRDSLGDEGDDVELRVSSPGAGKPFKVQRQYAKHIGRHVVVDLHDGRSLIGELGEWNEEKLGLRVEIPSKVKGRLPKLEKEMTYVSSEDIKATKARVAFK